MAPKKSNGFMVFTLEWKQKNGQHMNMEQAISAACEIWKKMGPKQREPYIKRAQIKQQLNGSQKTTSVNTATDYIEKERLKNQEMQEKMIKSIEKTIKSAVNDQRLEKEKFHFIMINYFTRLLNSNIYVPAEIAIVEFSLLDGVTRKYHTYVNPKIDLYGNVYEAQKHAETTHNLPLPPNAKGESDLRKIEAEIFNFLWNSNLNTYYPVYTCNNAMNYIISALSFLSSASESDNNEILSIEIFSIQELFYALKCAVCEKASIDTPGSRFITDSILKKDIFEYTSNIACDYHEEIDRSSCCALSQVCRWSFSFADYMAKDLSIILVPGRHIPGQFNANVVIDNTRNCASEKSTNGVCDAMSNLSIKSEYLSCDDYDQLSLGHTKSINHVNPISMIPKISGRRQLLKELLSNSMLAEDSIPPSYEIDCCKVEVETSIASSCLSRGRGRGRGIEVFDFMN